MAYPDLSMSHSKRRHGTNLLLMLGSWRETLHGARSIEKDRPFIVKELLYRGTDERVDWATANTEGETWVFQNDGEIHNGLLSIHPSRIKLGMSKSRVKLSWLFACEGLVDEELVTSRHMVNISFHLRFLERFRRNILQLRPKLPQCELSTIIMLRVTYHPPLGCF